MQRDAVFVVPPAVVENDVVERHLARQHRREQDAVVVGVRLGAEHGDVVHVGRELEQLFQRAHAGHAVADQYQFQFFHFRSNLHCSPTAGPPQGRTARSRSEHSLRHSTETPRDVRAKRACSLSRLGAGVGGWRDLMLLFSVACGRGSRVPQRGSARTPDRGPARGARAGAAASTSRISPMVAAGPLVIITMRSESSTASSTSWVTMTTVAPVLAITPFSSSCRLARVSASSAPKGSSSSSTLRFHGERAGNADALLHAARYFVRDTCAACVHVHHGQAPPRARYLQFRLAFLALPNTARRRDGRSRNRSSRAAALWFWNTTARSGPGPAISRPSQISTPSVGVVSPATRLSSVDLPQPECPISAMNSPFDVEIDVAQGDERPFLVSKRHARFFLS
jgi:hypothetical protein